MYNRAEYAALPVTSLGAGSLDVGLGFFLAETVKQNGVEIRKNDPGTDETCRHDSGAQAIDDRTTHNSMITQRKTWERVTSQAAI